MVFRRFQRRPSAPKLVISLSTQTDCVHVFLVSTSARNPGSLQRDLSVFFQTEAPISEPFDRRRTSDPISVSVFPCCDGARQHDIREKMQKPMGASEETGLKDFHNRMQISQDHRTRWEISFPDTNFMIKINRPDLDSQRSPAVISSERKDVGRFVRDVQTQEVVLRKTSASNDVVTAKKEAEYGFRGNSEMLHSSQVDQVNKRRRGTLDTNKLDSESFEDCERSRRRNHTSPTLAHLISSRSTQLLKEMKKQVAPETKVHLLNRARNWTTDCVPHLDGRDS